RERARVDALGRVLLARLGAARLRVTRHRRARHLEARVVDAVVVVALLAERARELTLCARERALAVRARRAARAHGAFVGLAVAVVVVAVTGRGRERTTDALHGAVDALLLAVADLTAAARAQAVDRVRALPVLVDLAVAVVVDVVARRVARRRLAVAR